MPAEADPLRDRLEVLVTEVVATLGAANAARELALPACRRTVQLAGSSIKAVHRLEMGRARELVAECDAVLRDAQGALSAHPSLQHAGFLHDAEKEFVEASTVLALVEGRPLPSAVELSVDPASWMKGLAEAASEMRRHLLDRLRDGDLARAQELFGVMEEVYDALMVVDFPDALTGGLRRTLDALRAVLERSRGDLTTTTVQARLAAAIDDRASRGS